MDADDVMAMFTLFQQANPIPKGDLVYRTPFELLVAVVLSAQATDKGVNRVTPSLFARASTPAAMAALGVEAIRQEIRTIGLFNTKARHIQQLSETLRDQFGGVVPDQRAALESLPGVGRKSANVVLNIAFGQPTIAVDTHVFRVANRTGLAPGSTPLAVEQGLMAVIPEPFLLHAHHWLIRHGRYVCQARRPHCDECHIHRYCHYPEKLADRP